MKKYILSLMAALVVFSVLAGCTGKPEPTPTPDNKPRSVEVGLDDPDLSDMSDDDHQTEGDFGDIDVSFKDPDNSDGIVITPRETPSPVSSTPQHNARKQSSFLLKSQLPHLSKPRHPQLPRWLCLLPSLRQIRM